MLRGDGDQITGMASSSVSPCAMCPTHYGSLCPALPHACKINVCAADVSDPLPQPCMGSAAFPEHLDHSEDAVLVSLPDPW